MLRGRARLPLRGVALGLVVFAAIGLPWYALVATRENAAKNGLAGRLTVAEYASDIAGHYDVVLANILSGPLIALAPGIAPKARVGSALLLAGMLQRQADEVAQAYRPWFDIGPAAEREGWTLLAGRRRPE